MRKIILWCFFIILSLNGLAQSVDSISSENYTTEAFKGVYIEMQNSRMINSGTKLVVKYEGDWPAEMQGAFEYAVKIWEENLPTALPINVTAKIGKIRGKKQLLSKVTFKTYSFEDDYIGYNWYPTSMIKSVLLQEYHTQQHRFYREISDTTMLKEEEDITITYNIDLLDQFSFSIDGEPNAIKYDFVTTALRDLAIGLGFTTSFTADVADKKIQFPNEKPTPFEELIMNSLKTSNPNTAFINATKGSLPIPLYDWQGFFIDSLSVYAPQNWENGISLRYFISQSNKPISRLLSYDFGKGYICRDLSGVDWDDIFCGALDWRRELTVGGGSGTISFEGNSSDKLPYTGEVSLSFKTTENSLISEKNHKEHFNSTFDKQASDNSIKASSAHADLPTTVFCKKFNYFSVDGRPAIDYGISLSVLKKDGTWDCVYIVHGENEARINIENLPLHYNESEYARGTTGGLRYRLTLCSYSHDGFDGRAYYTYRVKYFTRDFTPQRANIKYSRICANNESQRVSTSTDDDDYFVDVSIGISNIEGTERVIVEQLDEGESLPFKYEVHDFRKGSFIANLDRECSTQLTVTSYNAYGNRRSNTITIPPIGYSNNKISFKKDNDMIHLIGIKQKSLEGKIITYSLQDTMYPSKNYEKKNVSGETIYLKDLPKGIYVLTLFCDSHRIGTFKFAKQ